MTKGGGPFNLRPLRKERQAWKLYITASAQPSAEIKIDEETAWRVFTKGNDREQAVGKAELTGDKSLASKVLDAVAIIA